MFNLFKKNNALEIGSPINGKSIPIEDVKDPMFSQKMMGDGVAVVPSGNTFVAPCDGVISALFPSMHAYGITAADGTEILVHIGMDTVNENGNGFKSSTTQGASVKKGDVIIIADMDYLTQKYDMTTMVIVTSSKDKTIKERNENQDISATDTLFILK